MWANAQRDGRRVEYRWRPLFNAAKFGWRPLLHRVRKKLNQSIFASHFAKCWSIFENSFTNRLSSKFIGILLWNVSPYLKSVATLPCEILMSEKNKQPEVYNVIYDISQGIIATGFRSGETSNCDFIADLLLSLLWKNFFNRSISGEVTGKKADCLNKRCVRLHGTVLLKDEELAWDLTMEDLTYSKQKLS